jgi:hypothetical protein
MKTAYNALLVWPTAIRLYQMIPKTPATAVSVLFSCVRQYRLPKERLQIRLHRPRPWLLLRPYQRHRLLRPGLNLKAAEIFIA